MPNTYRTRNTKPCLPNSAFTLIELLVVIAIVALLLAILLPVLGSSRDTARQSLCLSNLKQAGLGINVYATDYEGYHPGPNTSGYSVANRNRDDAPIMRDDWMSPTLGPYLGLSDQWDKRLVEIFNNEFHCPSNPFYYDYIYPSRGSFPDPKTVRYNSYSAPITLNHYHNTTQASRFGQPGGLQMGDFREQGAVAISDKALTVFNINNMANPSLKAIAQDGSRYVSGTGNNTEISFNRNGAGVQYGLNFMNRGPGINSNTSANGNPYTYSGNPSILTERAKYAYRHVNQTLNIGFFDGHVENHDSVGSRKAEFWFPSGTVVTDAAAVSDPDVFNGYIVE